MMKTLPACAFSLPSSWGVADCFETMNRDPASKVQGASKGDDCGETTKMRPASDGGVLAVLSRSGRGSRQDDESSSGERGPGGRGPLTASRRRNRLQRVPLAAVKSGSCGSLSHHINASGEQGPGGRLRDGGEGTRVGLGK